MVSWNWWPIKVGNGEFSFYQQLLKIYISANNIEIILLFPG